jgi:hypothetical protein
MPAPKRKGEPAYLNPPTPKFAKGSDGTKVGAEVVDESASSILNETDPSMKTNQDYVEEDDPRFYSDGLSVEQRNIYELVDTAEQIDVSGWTFTTKLHHFNSFRIYFNMRLLNHVNDLDGRIGFAKFTTDCCAL